MKTKTLTTTKTEDLKTAKRIVFYLIIILSIVGLIVEFI